MSLPLVLLCSPNPGGTTDTAAKIFAEGMAAAGISPRLVPLRDYALTPCTGCNACAHPPHACVLAAPSRAAAEDRAEDVFALLLQAPLIVLAAPVFFYSLPAHFKALIDRAQRFWAQRSGTPHSPPAARPAPVPALALLAAGRTQGKQLFSGVLLTLTYFLDALNADIRDTRQLRGLETRRDLLQRPGLAANLRAWGQHWGRRLAAREETSAHASASPACRAH